MFRNVLYPGAQGRHLNDLKKEYDLIVTDEYEDAKQRMLEKYGQKDWCRCITPDLESRN